MGSFERRQGMLFAALLAAVGCGLFLHWPSLHSGFRGDDYVQGAMLRGSFPAPRHGLDLFDFTSGEAVERERLLDFGYLPWWTAPDVTLRMWRPLSSGLIALDHAWFGWHATPMHVHSLLWLAALLVAGLLLLRPLLPPSVTAVALVLFAIQPAHSVPVGWLANRNTLVATALGFLSIAAYVRFRAGGSLRHALAAMLFAVVALAAGEYALTALAYALAYELTAATDDVRSRVRALSVIAVPVALYVLLHSQLGADVIGSGYYVSPVRAPLQFLVALFTRVPVLLADLLLGLPAVHYMFGAPFRKELLALEWFTPDAWQALPDWTTLHVVLGYGVLLGSWLCVRFLTRRCQPDVAKSVRFLALGALLSLAPTAGALPGDRLLCAAALGACGVVATLLSVLVPTLAGTSGASSTARFGTALLVAALCALCFGHAATRAAKQAKLFAADSESHRVWALHAELPERGAEHARVYVIASADFTTSANLPWLRLVHGRPLSRSYRRLGPANTAVDIRRIDDRVIDLALLSKDTTHNAVPSLYRDIDHPLRGGERVKLPGLSVRVIRAYDGNPMLMRFTFDRSVDDESLWFLHSQVTGLRRVRMPEKGQSLRLLKPVMHDLRRYGLAPTGDFSE